MEVVNDLAASTPYVYCEPVPWGGMDHCAARCLAVRITCP